jgi:cytochrome c
MRPAAFAAVAALACLLAGCGSGAAPSAANAERTARLMAELPAPYDSADPARGRNLFALCSACHSIAEGGANMVGPNLYGVYGAAAAAKPGFAYSRPLKASGWTWDAARLDAWLADPQAALPGTKMVFLGVKDPQQRADLIAHLKVAGSL